MCEKVLKFHVLSQVLCTTKTNQQNIGFIIMHWRLLEYMECSLLIIYLNVHWYYCVLSSTMIITDQILSMMVYPLNCFEYTDLMS